MYRVVKCDCCGFIKPGQNDPYFPTNVVFERNHMLKKCIQNVIAPTRKFAKDLSFILLTDQYTNIGSINSTKGTLEIC